MTASIALLILILVPDLSEPPAVVSPGVQVLQLIHIYKDKAFLAIAPLLATTAGTHIAIQTLWAGPWLRDVAGLDRTGVANYLFAMGVAFLVGILGSGAITDWFVRRGASELAVMAGFLVLFLIAQIGIVLEVTSYGLLFWLMFGMSGQVAILAYPWLSGALRRRTLGPRQYGDEPADFSCRLHHPICDRRHHRAVPAASFRRVRSALLSGSVCSLSRPTDSDVRRISRQPAPVQVRCAGSYQRMSRLT